MANPFDISAFNLLQFAEIVNNLYDDTPMQLEVPVKQPSGSITYKNIQNLGQFKQRIWDTINANMQFNTARFYVDPVNGADTNTGLTKYDSFRTIKKAVDSVNIGGAGDIWLILSEDINNPTNIIIDESINLVNKSIFIRNLNDGYCVMQPEIELINGKYEVKGFNLTNSFLHITTSDNILLKLPRIQDTIPKFWWATQGFINSIAGHNSVAIGGYPPSDNSGILIEDNSCYFINHIIRDRYTTFTSISFQYLNIIQETAEQQNKLINIYSNQGSIALSSRGAYLKDGTGNALSWGDMISGLVKDSNGIPRNIVADVII